MRVLMLFAWSCAIWAAVYAMPFQENAQQLEQIPVRAFSGNPLFGFAGLNLITSLLGGSSSAATTALINSSQGVPELIGASSGASSGVSSGAGSAAVSAPIPQYQPVTYVRY